MKLTRIEKIDLEEFLELWFGENKNNWKADDFLQITFKQIRYISRELEIDIKKIVNYFELKSQVLGFRN